MLDRATSDPPTAVLFPGQGSHSDSLGEAVERARPDLAALAGELTGTDPFARLDEGTAFQQPAIFCASVAAWSQRPLAAGFFAGHSLGEISALVAAGSIAEDDALRLVCARGRAMQDAAERAAGGMLALLKGSPEDGHELATRFGVTVANDNAPGEQVLSGASEALAELAKGARAHGLRAVKLPVAGAFHSPAMEPARDAFAAALESVAIDPPHTPVFSCTTAAPLADTEEIRATLLAALTTPVRWRETMLALDRAGARRFVDAGPGAVLARLARRIIPGAEAGELAAAHA